MRALILTEGGDDIGFGHITRCIALYQGFKERNVHVEMIVNGKGIEKELFGSLAFNVFDWLKERNRFFGMIDRADMVIVDSYLADAEFYKRLSETVNTAVYMDDNKRVDYPAGVVINGGIYAEELDYPRKKEIRYLLGTKYLALRKDFWNAPERVVRNRAECMLITFGGDDARNMTPKVLKIAVDKYPQFTKNVIIGRCMKNISEIKKIKDAKTDLVYFPDSQKIRESMLKADIAISAAGQTLYELARIGVPFVAVAIADNQFNNLKGWQKNRLAEDIKWNDDFLSNKISDTIDNLIPHEERVKYSALARKFVDGKGVIRIIETLLE
jgi:UDP-2,4-diacetamido-2,4,6-trideoxy-beta-L-altropyranose hydrolase